MYMYIYIYIIHIYIFFQWALFSLSFTNHWVAGEGGGHFFSSSVPLLPASQALTHWPGDCWGGRGLASAHG